MKTLQSLVLVLCLAAVTSARADVIYFDGDTYAAIAYSPSTGKYGWANGYGTRTGAESAALNNCKYSDARIVTWVHNGFCALALGDDKSRWGIGYSYGDGATNTYARNRAVEECRKRTSNAHAVLVICSVNR